MPISIFLWTSAIPESPNYTSKLCVQGYLCNTLKPSSSRNSVENCVRQIALVGNLTTGLHRPSTSKSSTVNDSRLVITGAAGSSCLVPFLQLRAMSTGKGRSQSECSGRQMPQKGQNLFPSLKRAMIIQE